jgi:hypothetical protein
MFEDDLSTDADVILLTGRICSKCQLECANFSGLQSAYPMDLIKYEKLISI